MSGDNLRMLLGACSASFNDFNQKKLQIKSEIDETNEALGKLLATAEQATINFDVKSSAILKTTEQAFSSEFEKNQNIFKEAQSRVELDVQNTIKTTNELFIKTQKTYEELLRLQAPAKYWEMIKTRYEKRAHLWTIGSIVVAVAIFVITILTVYFLPDILYTEKKSIELVNSPTINLSSFIRWGILTGLGLSVLIYLLRFFIKMALSAYHMARDAEERYTLTYLYLSLVNEGKFDSSQTPIVFSSLFSRVDTGLLKGDSSPTIVGGTSQIIDMVKGNPK
jgi:hypothetical protein